MADEKVVVVGANASRIGPETHEAQTEAKYRGLLEAAPDAIVVVDQTGTIVLLNIRAEAQFGYSRDELLGQKVQTIIPEGFAERLVADGLRSAAEALAQEIGTGIELYGRRKNGSNFPIEIMLSPLENAEGILVTAAIRDISPRKAAEARLEQKMEEIRTTNEKLSAALRAENKSQLEKKLAEDANQVKADFLANMSHEIRTPMNAIMGMTHLALRTNPNAKQYGYLTIIDKSSRALLRIVNDILDFSKIEAHEMELENIPFSLDDVLKDLNDIVGQSAEAKNILLSVSLADDAPRHLRGDPLRLGQILINLVGNAIKFTETGEVVLRVGAEQIDEQGAVFTFTVSDTGIGMTPEQVLNLFQPFNQADMSITRTFGGTGLGLSICKQLCSLMGGSLVVKSEFGKGSAFTLKVKFGLIAGNLPDVERQPTDYSRPKVVLVIDENENARGVSVAMLEANGLSARAVSSGEEALLDLRNAQNSGKVIDLVLMDWKMPGLNGIETSSRIKSELKSSRIPSIVMISAFELGEITNGVADPKLDGFLVKPVKESQLIDTVFKVLDRESAKSNSSFILPPLEESSALVGRRVLLVDDNEINRELAAELLGDLGISVTTAVNGLDGFERVAAEPFDLILMDIQMPVMDGLTATRRIRGTGETLPIIAMTAHALSADRKRSLDAGMNDHLTKPISPDNLRDVLLRWMPPTLSRLSKQKIQGRRSIPILKQVSDRSRPFNLIAALERTSGKPKLLQSMMVAFRDTYRNSVAELKSLVAQGMLEEAERLAHSMKGVAATLEAGELAKAADAVECAFRENRIGDLSLLFTTLEVVLREAVQAVNALEPAASPRLRSITDVVISVSTKSRLRLLIVDDDTFNFSLLLDIFGSEFEVLFASNGKVALDTAVAAAPDVIVLDVMMPGLDGFEVCKQLKASRVTRDIPVIFLTGLGDVATEAKAFECGAADFVNKPINSATFKARVSNQIALKLAHERLIELAMTDQLTGLSNRRRFDEMMTYEYARHTRSKGHLSVIMIDVDHFKSFNDTYGHVAGDGCLRRIARALEGVLVRATDLVARYGGEEFVCLLPETELSGALLVANEIQRAISNLAISHPRAGRMRHVTTSLGVISGLCIKGRSTLNLIAKADEQLYIAKNSGRDRICSAEVP